MITAEVSAGATERRPAATSRILLLEQSDRSFAQTKPNRGYILLTLTHNEALGKSPPRDIQQLLRRRRGGVDCVTLHRVARTKAKPGQRQSVRVSAEYSQPMLMTPPVRYNL